MSGVEPFDTVVVPDFQGARSRAFEARTLLFLASWIEHAGRARDFPLHVASIGEPPRSVRWLADRASASLSVHRPIGGNLGGPSNKLRGLDVDPRTERFLLLDADVVVLGDLAEAAALGRCLAAAPALVPRVPETYWRRIYAALGLELPEERVACVTTEMRCRPYPGPLYPEQAAEMPGMLPYYNSGVLYGPWGCGLRELWEEHSRRIVSLFGEDEPVWRSIRVSDQTGLATAVQALRSRGMPFRRLPAGLHGTWLHLYRAEPALAGTRLFHAMFAFGKTTEKTRGLGGQLVRFRLHLLHRLLGEWRGDEVGLARAASRFLLPSLRDAIRLGRELQSLYRKHVVPALRA